MDMEINLMNYEIFGESDISWISMLEVLVTLLFPSSTYYVQCALLISFNICFWVLSIWLTNDIDIYTTNIVQFV